MDKIKQTFLKRYGVAEYFLFILGAVLLMFQAYKYITNTLAGSTLDFWVAVVAMLFVLAPLTIVNLIRKARGLEPK